MKKHRNPRAIEFFATQLSYAVKRKVAGADPQKVVVFSVPRSRKSRRVYGLDQAELLAEKLAEVCGFRYLKLIKRSRNSGAAQKKKNLSKRVKDAKKQFAPDLKQIKLLGDAELIVAVDDILTSGASLAGCIEKLKKYYKGKFICATVGRTGKRRKK
jgi:predicted amidophosphoribosyltransferase